MGLAMGRPGELKRPVLSAGPLKELNDALHELHLDAGLPTLSAMYQELGKRISRSSLHDALTGTVRPPWDTVESLVEILGTRSPRTTAEREIDRFHQLWVAAARSVIAEGPASSSLAAGSDTAPSDGLFWIIATDIAGSSPLTDPVQATMRMRLYDDVGEALDFAGLKDAAQTLDRGDGLLVLVPAEKSRLGPLLGFLLHLQRLIVDQDAYETRLRLRVCVTRGELAVSDAGWWGNALVTSSRLLNADALRSAMSNQAVLAVAVSEEIHDDLGDLKPRGFRPQFHHALAFTKAGDIPTWIYTAQVGV